MWTAGDPDIGGFLNKWLKTNPTVIVMIDYFYFKLSKTYKNVQVVSV